MKIGTMLSDVTTSLFKKPVTQRYPFERYEPPQQLRAFLVWDPANCTGCSLCAMDCPAGAIEMTVIDKKARRFVMHYHVDRCTFCAQCVHSCRQGGLSMTSETWELAGLDRSCFDKWYGDPQDVELAMGDEAAEQP